jgi:hypothetical protein
MTFLPLLVLALALPSLSRSVALSPQPPFLFFPFNFELELVILESERKFSNFYNCHRCMRIRTEISTKPLVLEVAQRLMLDAIIIGNDPTVAAELLFVTTLLGALVLATIFRVGCMIVALSRDQPNFFCVNVLAEF